MKTKRINVRVAVKEKDDLAQVSSVLDIPEAVIVRDAVKEKIKELKLKIQTDKKVQVTA